MTSFTNIGTDHGWEARCPKTKKLSDPIVDYSWEQFIFRKTSTDLLGCPNIDRM